MSSLGKIQGMDKIVHAVIYGIQTALLIAAWRSCRPGDRLWLCAGAATAYGALMEVLQRTCTSCRQFSWGDMLANALGAGIVAASLAGWTAWRSSRRLK